MGHRRHFKGASAAGLSVLGLLAWMLWTLATEPAPVPAPGPAPAPLVRVQAADPTAAELPVVDRSDEPLPTRGPDASEPEELSVEVIHTGPDAILGLVLDGLTEQPVTTFQVFTLEASPTDVWSRLDESEGRLFRQRTGAFRIALQPGRWDVVVRAPGYLPTHQLALEVPAVDSTPTAFVLRRGPGIEGTAYDGRGGVAANIKAHLHIVSLADPADKRPLVRITTTNADGRFGFSPLPPGDYIVSLLEIDNPADRSGTLRVSEDTLEIELYVVPRHQLTVQVHDEGGRPLEAVLVELKTAGHFARGHTNASGLVVLDYLPDGTYSLKASRAGFRVTQEPLQLIGGSTTTTHWLRLDRRP